jgi:hypothetical protein
MIKANPVSDKFWILKDDNGKVGEVNINNNKYTVTVNGRTASFQTRDAVTSNTGIEFLPNNTCTSDVPQTSVYGYPIPEDNSFNAVWNLKLSLPLYTSSEDSKSWHAAGYYLVKIKDKWKNILSPRLIILQRNDYRGPYKENPTHDSY